MQHNGGGLKIAERGAAMDLLTLMVADYANVAVGQKLNVMGVFNQIGAQTFPAQHPEMWVVAKLSASPAEANTTRTITVKLLNEDATEELVNFSREIEVPEGPSGRRVEINHILSIRNVVFREPGTYQFSLLVDSDEKGSLPLYILQLPTEGE